ncbi:Hypothetical predicted protein [Mytilus galloprovincialis]|uniref:Uncharacterized protein n=1 Tax=Mytilus galloprovincialis TaxID=29158 RepID=A0A8B6GQV4_MYTGA|nr:Hypothetical predicted protein [Mytilus galloprovincialis]
MSDGVEIKIPKVVRTVNSTRIIYLYTEFCKSCNFDKLSRATLFKILKISAASQKTSLRGLVNTIADGMKSIEMLEKILRKCNTFGLPASTVKDISSHLQRVNQHLQFEVKGHISTETNIALHCSTYALSDISHKDYCGSCNHEHSGHCDICTQITQIAENVLVAYREVESQVPIDIREEMEHEISLADKMLHEWHSHCVRTVHQEGAKQSILSNLQPNETLIIMDWAMKLFLFFIEKNRRNSLAKREYRGTSLVQS